MNQIIEYFMGSPEAVVGLILFALSTLGAAIAMGFSLFAKFPIVVRLLENRSLIYVDDAHQDKVSVLFKRKDRELEIKQLRQIDFEIFNSHPRLRVENESVTINLPDPQVTVLVAAAANRDNRTPDLGGRNVDVTVVNTLSKPADLLALSAVAETFPAIVVKIPFLESSLSTDCIYLRVTYDGPYFLPEVLGATFTSARLYRLEQHYTIIRTFATVSLIGIAFMILGMYSNGSSFSTFSDFILMARYYYGNYYLAGLAIVMLGFALLASSLRWGEKYRSVVRPLSRMIWHPIPKDVESLGKLHFYTNPESSMQEGNVEIQERK